MEKIDFTLKNSRHIQVQERLGDLFTPSFGPELNACVYPRRLTLDFNALARDLAGRMEEGCFIRHMDYNDLAGMRNQLDDPAKQAALDFLIKDADDLLDLHRPGYARLTYRLIRANPAEKQKRAEAERFHADGEVDDPYFENVLCTYTGTTTEYLTGKKSERQCFGLGHIWRFACRNSEATAKPFIHRAPRVQAPEEPRLVLLLMRSNRPLWPEFEV